MPSLQKEEWDRPTAIQVWDTISTIIAAEPVQLTRRFYDASFRTINLELLEHSVDNFYNIYRHGMYPQDVWDLLQHSPYRKFYASANYYERLDFIELLIQGDGTPEPAAAISKALNNVFSDRFVAYRLVNGKVTDIDDKKEREAVEAAMRESAHIEKAVALLYNRDNPDPANSIKESISAVEDVCKEITGKPKATLADCLRVIDDKAPMHGAFKEALTKLYGYTSDEGGIRHAGLSGGEVAFEEAKFMLVACSAFCNYLRAKQTKL